MGIVLGFCVSFLLCRLSMNRLLRFVFFTVIRWCVPNSIFALNEYPNRFFNQRWIWSLIFALFFWTCLSVSPPFSLSLCLCSNKLTYTTYSTWYVSKSTIAIWGRSLARIFYKQIRFWLQFFFVIFPTTGVSYSQESRCRQRRRYVIGWREALIFVRCSCLMHLNFALYVLLDQQASDSDTSDIYALKTSKKKFSKKASTSRDPKLVRAQALPRVLPSNSSDESDSGSPERKKRRKSESTSGQSKSSKSPCGSNSRQHAQQVMTGISGFFFFYFS